MERNDSEVELLMKNPGKLILQYQRMIEVIVQLNINSGRFKQQDLEDIVQFINERLLERIEKIRKQYNGISLLRTYLTAIIRNLCLEWTRDSLSHTEFDCFNDSQSDIPYEPNPIEKMAIRQELQRLDKILSLYHTHRVRVEFCFKAVYRVPMSERDFLCYYPLFRFEELDEAVNFFLHAEPAREGEVLKHLTEILNHCEKKSNSKDAVRKWMETRKNELIELLNGRPKRCNYTVETLQYLMERYFVEFPMKAAVHEDVDLSEAKVYRRLIIKE